MSSEIPKDSQNENRPLKFHEWFALIGFVAVLAWVIFAENSQSPISASSQVDSVQPAFVIPTSESDAEAKAKAEKAEADQKAAEEARAAALPFDAGKVLSDYETNEISADRFYKGRRLGVSGKVRRVARDVLNNPYVTLAGDHPSFQSVQCFFSPRDESQLSQLSPGDTVTIVGRFDGMMINVLLKDCRIAGQ